MKISRIALTNSPLYMMNNLTSTQSQVAFLSMINDKLKINILNKKNKEIQQILIQDSSVPTSINFCTDSCLMVTTQNGYYGYNENGKEILNQQKHTMNHLEQDSCFMGSTYIVCEDQQTVYAIGYGNQVIFINSGQPKSKEYFSIKLTASVTYITNFDEYIVIGTDEGKLIIYQCQTMNKIIFQKEIDLQNNKTAVLCCKILNRKNQSSVIIAGDFIGRVTLIDTKSYLIFSTINCHIKPIMGIDINKIKEQFITVSEDTYVNIWKINQQNEPQLVSSQQIVDAVLIGVTSDIYVGCYDMFELTNLDNQN